MRTRALALTAGLLVIALMGVLIGTQSNVSARFQTNGTPVDVPADEATPVADEEETPETEPTEGILTFVMWYQQNENGEIALLSPVDGEGFMVSQGESTDPTEEGRVVWTESRNEDYPRIRLGEENYFDAYPVYPQDPNTVQRWIYFNDDPEIRPATMVMQIIGIRGEYDEWSGTATFISRGSDQGGILVIAISPPADE